MKSFLYRGNFVLLFHFAPINNTFTHFIYFYSESNNFFVLCLEWGSIIIGDDLLLGSS